jgi:hypothetical protein
MCGTRREEWRKEGTRESEKRLWRQAFCVTEREWDLSDSGRPDRIGLLEQTLRREPIHNELLQLDRALYALRIDGPLT